MKLKKVLGIFIISGLFSTATFAEDLLAKITNGAVSDTSEGVRVLSEEEASQVKGGILVYLPYQVSKGYVGNYRYATGVYEIGLTPEEMNRGIAVIAGHETESISRKAQNYLDFKWLTSVDAKNEFPALVVQYNYNTRQLGAEVLVFNGSKGTTRRVNQSLPFIQKIMTSPKIYERVMQDFIQKGNL